MAVTQDEERASKISDALSQRLEDMVDRFKAKSISAPWGNYPSFQTAQLCKKRPDGSLDYMRYHIFPQHKGDNVLTADGIRCDRVTGDKHYATIIKGTKTKKPIDRLLTELKKKITKDLRNAWCETEEEAKKTSATTLKKPMLLSKWEKQKKKIVYPCYAQPKHDGIRCMYDGDTGKLYSRSGKVVDLPHITDQLKAFNTISLDGEIAFEDYTVPLPEVIHAISAKDINLKFHVFDNISDDNVHLSFQIRFINMLPGWFKSEGLVSSCDAIRVTDTQRFDSEDEIDAYYEAATSAGMEGIVIRNADSPYQFGKRTMFTLKYKLEYEEQFRLIGYQIIPHPEGDLIQFVAKLNDKQFELVPAWKHSERRECLAKLLKAGYEPEGVIGGLPMMLVEYRGITPDGKPYHAVGKTTWKKLKGSI
jgi:hypothetical protein